MKYTNYILHGKPINFDETGVWGIPAALAALPIMTGFLCGAAIMDGGRYTKLQYTLHKRERGRTAYIKGVLRSLNIAPSKQNVSRLRSL